MKLIALLIILITQIFWGCQESTPDNDLQPVTFDLPLQNNPKPVSVGRWGGDGIEMSVLPRGANFKIECGRGNIKQRMNPDDEGNFLNTGTIQFLGGPPRNAFFEGQVTNDTMVLNISWEDHRGRTQQENYVLKKGQKEKLGRCHPEV